MSVYGTDASRKLAVTIILGSNLKSCQAYDYRCDMNSLVALPIIR